MKLNLFFLAFTLINTISISNFPPSFLLHCFSQETSFFSYFSPIELHEGKGICLFSSLDVFQVPRIEPGT